MNVKEISEIIKLIDQSSIEEFTYESEGTSVTLKKSNEQGKGNQIISAPEVQNEQMKTSQPQAGVIMEEEKESPKEEQTSRSEGTQHDHEIVSPMVGTFYSAPSPESDPFVSVGSKIGTDTVVCIVEAMKLFNEIEAEVTGEIVEILVENGELVEYGQPLFRVKSN